jgi:hypothetical protein
MLLAITMLHRKMIFFFPFFMDDRKTMSARFKYIVRVWFDVSWQLRCNENG